MTPIGMDQPRKDGAVLGKHMIIIRFFRPDLVRCWLILQHRFQYRRFREVRFQITECDPGTAGVLRYQWNDSALTTGKILGGCLVRLRNWL